MSTSANGPPENSGNPRASQSVESAVISGAKSRREWIKFWEGCNPGNPSPCSAKAVYRLADREFFLSSKNVSRGATRPLNCVGLDLGDLKQRAFQVEWNSQLSR